MSSAAAAAAEGALPNQSIITRAPRTLRGPGRLLCAVGGGGGGRQNRGGRKVSRMERVSRETHEIRDRRYQKPGREESRDGIEDER